MTSTSTMTMTSRPTSLSDSGVQMSPDAAETPADTLTSLVSPLSDSNSSMMSDDGKRGDDGTRTKSRMEKYFAEKPDKNIFMKLIHPSYHERNLQFKKIFVDKGLIEETDQFLASYSCAYQREILAQGRMFISQFNVCFYANIIGWETTLVIPMKEIKLIKKMKAAFIFPNSIQFERETSEKYFFASFINRDKSFQVLTTAHQKVIEEGRAMTREEVWDMVYNSEEKNTQNQTPPEGGTPASTKTESTENMTNLASPSYNNGSIPTPKNVEKDNTSQSSTSSDFHDDESTAHLSEQMDMEDEEVVSCQCENHAGRLLMEKDIKVSVEKFYELMFTESPFFAECNVRMKVDSFVAATWVRDHKGENTRTCTFNVSVTNPLAPKAIIVNEKQTLTRFPNPKQGFTMHKETHNGGVPYAENFTVDCRYCVSRTGPMSCRVKVHGSINYKKSTWGFLKTIVEKSTFNALDEHYKTLSQMFDEYTEKNPEADKRSVTSSTFPETNDTTETSEIVQSSDTQSPRRRRRSQKIGTERLIAGGELKKGMNDDNFSSEMRSRNNESSSLTQRPKGEENSAEYKPFLLAIIVLLALFLFANLYVIQGFHREATVVVSRNEKDFGDMLSTLLSEVKELKERVNQMKKNE
uniref:VASt domain-containing protein n=1 Tax=Caenorhabditis tropicalis TaxID=1561998 RepID=A0A1I7UXL5_9PELO